LRQIQKGMSVEDIAEMLDVPISEIEAMIGE
jgi:DNA-directed RNA polymerase specialized sigma24 family protein